MQPTVAIIQWLGAPMASGAISFVYFVKSRQLVIGRRIAVSAHGFLLLMIYLIAALVDHAELYRSTLIWPFLASFFGPALSIVLALAWYPGNKALHLLVLPLLYCGLWIALIGGMAITGNWL